jgi:hypothetical protein
MIMSGLYRSGDVSLLSFMTPAMRAMLTVLFTLVALAITPDLFASDFYPITESDKKFVAEVVKAVQKKDLAWIAQHMLYPLSVTNSDNTQLVKTEKEFEKILSRKLTDSVSTKIVDAAKQPFFKNWRGVRIGDGLLWFAEYGSDVHGPWTQGILAIGQFAWQPKEDEQLMHVIGPYPDSPTVKRCLRYWTANFSTNAVNHFYVGAVQPQAGFPESLVYWKEERTILQYDGLAADAPKGTEIEALRNPLRLDLDTVDTPDEIGGSSYLVSHRAWVDWMEQSLSRGREYIISLEEAKRFYPNPAFYYGGSTNTILAYYKCTRPAVYTAPEKAVCLTNGITFKGIVEMLGPGWRPPTDGIGLVCWRFTDGRTLCVHLPNHPRNGSSPLTTNMFKWDAGWPSEGDDHKHLPPRPRYLVW